MPGEPHFVAVMFQDDDILKYCRKLGAFLDCVLFSACFGGQSQSVQQCTEFGIGFRQLLRRDGTGHDAGARLQIRLLPTEQG